MLGHVDEREAASVAHICNVLDETVYRSRAGGSTVDSRGGAASQAGAVRVDGALHDVLIHVRVDVDQARRDEQPAHVPLLAPRARWDAARRLDGRDAIAQDCDVGHRPILVAGPSAVHRAAAQHEIVPHGGCCGSRRIGLAAYVRGDRAHAPHVGKAGRASARTLFRPRRRGRRAAAAPAGVNQHRELIINTRFAPQNTLCQLDSAASTRAASSSTATLSLCRCAIARTAPSKRWRRAGCGFWRPSSWRSVPRLL
jgi:hypothetical protein